MNNDALWASLGMWEYVRIARDGTSNRVLYYGKPMTTMQQYLLFEEVMKQCREANAAYGVRADVFFMKCHALITERMRTLGRPLGVWHMMELIRQENRLKNLN